jgi:LacI family transcriptional regulator
VFAWDSARARQVTEACQMAEIRIPREVVVLAGDYDEVMCHTSHPPFSSVDLPAEQVGYQAARLLEQLILDASSPPKSLLVEPQGISVRQSTDWSSMEDRQISKAIAFIRNHACDGINVRHVLKEVPVGRRSLEQRFLRVLGRSPAAEIRRVRLERAKQLLENGELSVAQVARASGYQSADILLRNFRREFGQTPSRFRKKVHPR